MVSTPKRKRGDIGRADAEKGGCGTPKRLRLEREEERSETQHTADKEEEDVRTVISAEKEEEEQGRTMQEGAAEGGKGEGGGFTLKPPGTHQKPITSQRVMTARRRKEEKDKKRKEQNAKRKDERRRGAMIARTSRVNSEDTAGSLTQDWKPN